MGRTQAEGWGGGYEPAAGTRGRNGKGASGVRPDPMAGTEFHTVRPLGGGATSEVFEVASSTGQLFVAKILRIDKTGTLTSPDRMRLEAEALAAVKHPNVVRILGRGITRGHRPYVILERLAGRTLADELDERRTLPLVEVLQHIAQALAGLRAVHARGLIHRDIKLENIWLCDTTGVMRRVVLLDFGLGKVVDGGEGGVLPLRVPTGDSVFVGTARYASPEQAAGEAVDARSDLYSVGLVMRTMLVGHEPFARLDTDSSLLRAQMGRPLEPMDIECKEKARVQWIVNRALEKNPAHRFQTVDEFSEALRDTAAVLRLPPWMVAFDPLAEVERVREAAGNVGPGPSIEGSEPMMEGGEPMNVGYEPMMELALQGEREEPANKPGPTWEERAHLLARTLLVVGGLFVACVIALVALLVRKW